MEKPLHLFFPPATFTFLFILQKPNWGITFFKTYVRMCTHTHTHTHTNTFIIQEYLLFLDYLWFRLRAFAIAGLSMPLALWPGLELLDSKYAVVRHLPAPCLALDTCLYNWTDKSPLVELLLVPLAVIFPSSGGAPTALHDVSGIGLVTVVITCLCNMHTYRLCLIQLYMTWSPCGMPGGNRWVMYKYLLNACVKHIITEFQMSIPLRLRKYKRKADGRNWLGLGKPGIGLGRPSFQFWLFHQLTVWFDLLIGLYLSGLHWCQV